MLLLGPPADADQGENIDQLNRGRCDLLYEAKAGEDIATAVESRTRRSALVDEAQLETALLNIAINARDAMPEGGTLTIATGNAELDADYVAHHPGVAPGDYVEIEIADTGVGMAPDVVERIFEPFFTTKAAEQGHRARLEHGVWLHEAIQRPHQRLQRSRPGNRVQAVPAVGAGGGIPCRPAAAGAASRTARHSGEAVILAVDDNPDVRATVVVQLKGLGYRVREADNARSPPWRSSTARTGSTCLFTDVVMPGRLNGKELATQARVKRPDLKVLFTSGFPGTATGPGQSSTTRTCS